MANATRKVSAEVLKRTEVVKKGHQLLVPEDMTTEDAIKALQRQLQQDNQRVTINEIFECSPLDGAHALKLALAEEYGWVASVPTPGFFGPNPPQIVGVDVSPTEKVQVIWGGLAIPNIAGQLNTAVHIVENRQVFRIAGWTLQKHKKTIAKIVETTRKMIREQSIYRGKAIKVDFRKIDPAVDAQAGDPFYTAPKFIDLSKANPNSLVLPRSVRNAVEDNIFTPILQRKMCLEHKVPFRRGVLLYGPYGTGKTLVANITGKYAQDNGITYLYIDKVQDLPAALAFLRMYAPAVLFVEDIDSVLTGPRTEDMNQYLNTIDGIGFKDSDVMLVATTNNLKLIHKAVLRNGRFDAIINIPPPDAEAAELLIRQYADSLIDKNENLRLVAEKLAGAPAAAIRGVVENSKLAGITRLSRIAQEAKEKGLPVPEEALQLRLTAGDLDRTVEASREHLEMQKPTGKDAGDERPENPISMLGRVVGEGIGKGMGEAVTQTTQFFAALHTKMEKDGPDGVTEKDVETATEHITRIAEGHGSRRSRPEDNEDLS